MRANNARSPPLSRPPWKEPASTKIAARPTTPVSTAIAASASSERSLRTTSQEARVRRQERAMCPSCGGLTATGWGCDLVAPRSVRARALSVRSRRGCSGSGVRRRNGRAGQAPVSGQAIEQCAERELPAAVDRAVAATQPVRVLREGETLNEGEEHVGDVGLIAAQHPRLQAPAHANEHEAAPGGTAE